MAEAFDEHVEVTVRRGARVHDDPRVSVVVPAYRPPWLEETLQSIRRQTFGPLEIVVVDDGSPEPVQPAQVDDLVLVRQPNAGPGGARNRGVGLARGEYVAFLDSDDCWLPEKLERQVAFHDARPDCVLSTTDTRWVGADGSRVESELGRYGLAGELIPFETLFHENCIATSAAMVRREAYLRTPGMVPGRWSEEYDCWLRLALLGTVGWLPEVLVERREYAQSWTAVNKALKRSDDELTTYREFLDEHPELRGERFVAAALARAQYDRGWAALGGGEWTAARTAFRAVLSHDRGHRRAWLGLLRAMLRLGPRRRQESD